MRIIAELRNKPGLDYPENLDLTDKKLKQRFIGEMCYQIRTKLELRTEDKIEIIFDGD